MSRVSAEWTIAVRGREGADGIEGREAVCRLEVLMDQVESRVVPVDEEEVGVGEEVAVGECEGVVAIIKVDVMQE